MGATLTARLLTLEDRRTRAALARVRASWAVYCAAADPHRPADPAARDAYFRGQLARYEAGVAALPPAEQARCRAVERALEALVAATCPDLPAARRLARDLATDPATPAHLVLADVARVFDELARTEAAGEEGTA